MCSQTTREPSVKHTRVLRRASLWAAAFTLTIAGAFVAAPSAAQDVELGKQIWLTKVNCRDCHGWGAHGVQDDPQSPKAPNLRISILSPEEMATAILCGRPGTEMPYFSRFSYTDDRCYGLTAEALGKDMMPAPGNAHLSKRAMNSLIALIQSFQAQNEQPTFEECKQFWGENATLCGALR